MDDPRAIEMVNEMGAEAHAVETRAENAQRLGSDLLQSLRKHGVAIGVISGMTMVTGGSVTSGLLGAGVTMAGVHYLHKRYPHLRRHKNSPANRHRPDEPGPDLQGRIGNPPLSPIHEQLPAAPRSKPPAGPSISGM